MIQECLDAIEEGYCMGDMERPRHKDGWIKMDCLIDRVHFMWQSGGRGIGERVEEWRESE